MANASAAACPLVAGASYPRSGEVFCTCNPILVLPASLAPQRFKVLSSLLTSQRSYESMLWPCANYNFCLLKVVLVTFLFLVRACSKNTISCFLFWLDTATLCSPGAQLLCLHSHEVMSKSAHTSTIIIIVLCAPQAI